METYTLGYKFRIYPNRTQEIRLESSSSISKARKHRKGSEKNGNVHAWL